MDSSDEDDDRRTQSHPQPDIAGNTNEEDPEPPESLTPKQTAQTGTIAQSAGNRRTGKKRNKPGNSA